MEISRREELARILRECTEDASKPVHIEHLTVNVYLGQGQANPIAALIQGLINKPAVND